MCDQMTVFFQVAHNTCSFHMISYRAEMGAGCAVLVSLSLEGGQDHLHCPLLCQRVAACAGATRAAKLLFGTPQTNVLKTSLPGVGFLIPNRENAT